MRLRINFSICLIIVLCAGCSYEFPEIEESAPELPVELNQVMVIGGSWLSGAKDGVLDNNAANTGIGNLLLSQITGEEASSFGLNISEGMGTNFYRVAVGRGRSFLNYSTEDHFRPILEFETDGSELSYGLRPVINHVNLSFPGFRAFQLHNGDILTSSVEPTGFDLGSILDANQPNFVILEVGIEEFIRYALNGAEGDANVTSLLMLDDEDLLSSEAYGQYVQGIVDRVHLNNPGANIVLVNTPDITKFAYFYQLVDYNILDYLETDEEFQEVTVIRAEHPNYNNVLISFYQQNPNLPWHPANVIWRFENPKPWQLWNWRYVLLDDEVPLIQDFPFTFEDENGITQTELVTLPQQREIRGTDRALYHVDQRFFNEGYGLINNPISENDIIDFREVQTITDRIEAFNNELADIAFNSSNIRVFDLHSTFEEFFIGEERDEFPFRKAVPADGIRINNVPMSPGFLVNGFFSTDGINPNARGSAYITNQLIRFINENYDLDIESLIPNRYPGNKIISSF